MPESLQNSFKYAYDFDPTNQSTPAKIARLTHQHATGAVLEVGTGPGSISKVLRQHYNLSITGIELIQEYAELARPFLTELYIADAQQASLWANFKDNQFSVVVLADVLEHLTQHNFVLEQIYRVLISSGKLIISVPNMGFAGILAALKQDDFPYVEKGLLDQTHVRFYTEKTLNDLLSHHGFQLIDSQPTLAAPEHTEFAAHWLTLSQLEQDFLKTYPKALTYQHVCLYAKPA